MEGDLSPPEKKTKLIDEQTDTESIGEDLSSIEDDEKQCVTWLSEKDVGIAEYISNDNEGIQGIIKQRYSDFLVAEIDKAGCIVKLTSYDTPTEEKVCGAVLDRDIADKLANLSEGPANQSVTIEVENMDKDQRRAIHEAVRNLQSGLESSTEEKDGKKVIVMKKARPGNPRRQSWPANRGNYTHFTMYKENMDTMEAINLLGRVLHIRPDAFTYAGVKDKRAKTTQRVSIYRVEARKLLNVNPKLRNLRLGNVEYKKTALALGDLQGNHFRLIIRDIKNPGATLHAAMSSLKENGFLNYYGMQRFGTTTIPTHRIGRALLKGDWAQAVHLILAPRPGDDAKYHEYRQVWADTKDADKAMAVLKKKNSVEGQLLNGISKHGVKDLVNAISMIPRNVRLMYLHSYQSYVWNLVLSRRIRKYGLRVIEGDLIFEENVGNEAKKKPIVISDVDIAAKSLSITQVVLPLPGHDVLYPQNEIGDWFKEFLQNDDLDLSNLKHKVKAYSLSGAYRAIIIRPTNFSYATLPYDDNEVPLLLSDLDCINGAAEPLHADGGKFEALKVEFSLPSSCYATMALREITKVDTSAAFQSKLTDKRFLLCEQQNVQA